MKTQPKKASYRTVVTLSRCDLDGMVNALMNDGYSLCEGPYFVDLKYCQTMRQTGGPRTIEEYKTVAARTAADFDKKVNELLDAGFELYDRAFAISTTEGRFCQALTKG